MKKNENGELKFEEAMTQLEEVVRKLESGDVPLEDSLAASDLAQLTEVSRRYFHTKAGYEATLLLGRIQLDQGRPLAAALTLKRIGDVPTAAAQGGWAVTPFAARRHRRLRNRSAARPG